MRRVEDVGRGSAEGEAGALIGAEVGSSVGVQGAGGNSVTALN